MNLYTAERRMAFWYRAPVKTRTGEWTEVAIALDGFEATSFGRVLPGVGPVDPGSVTSIGFLLAEKTPVGKHGQENERHGGCLFLVGHTVLPVRPCQSMSVSACQNRKVSAPQRPVLRHGPHLSARSSQRGADTITPLWRGIA